jgi:hypothetical protein
MKTRLHGERYPFDIDISDSENENEATGIWCTVCIWHGFSESGNGNESKQINNNHYQLK